MQVRIKGYTFSLAAPYSEGHSLTAGEAQALNDLRTENIQNNFRTLVNEQVARLEPGQLLAQSVLDGLSAKLAEYDSGYKFNEKSGRNRLGDIELEIQLVAVERATLQIAQLAESPDKLAELVAEFIHLPAVKEEARSRVAARRSVLSGGIESL